MKAPDIVCQTIEYMVEIIIDNILKWMIMVELKVTQTYSIPF